MNKSSCPHCDDCEKCDLPDCEATQSELKLMSTKRLKYQHKSALPPNPVKHYEIVSPTWDELYPSKH